jgi:DNA polymerase III gamma/tau subunit
MFCNDTIEVVRTLMHIRTCGVDTPIADVPAGRREKYDRLARQFELSQYVQLIAMLEELRRNVRFSGAGRALTDALMVRFAKMHEWAPIEQLLSQLQTAAAGEKKNLPASVGKHAEPTSEPQPPLASNVVPARPATQCQPHAAEDPPRGYADLPEAGGCEAEFACNDANPANEARSATARMPVSPEERGPILNDPLVQQVLETFDGIVINMERTALPVTSEEDAPTE